MIDAREGKLPAWARAELSRQRERISSLEARLAEQIDRLESVTGLKPDECDTVADPYGTDGPWPLGNEKTIEFRLGKRRNAIRVRTTKRPPGANFEDGKGRIEIMADRAVTLQVGASNVVYISMDE